MVRHVGATQPGSRWVGSAEVQVVPCSFIAMESLDFWEDDLADGDCDEILECGVEF